MKEVLAVDENDSPHNKSHPPRDMVSHRVQQAGCRCFYVTTKPGTCNCLKPQTAPLLVIDDYVGLSMRTMVRITKNTRPGTLVFTYAERTGCRWFHVTTKLGTFICIELQSTPLPVIDD